MDLDCSSKKQLGGIGIASILNKNKLCYSNGFGDINVRIQVYGKIPYAIYTIRNLL